MNYHQGQPVVTRGAALDQAQAVMILIHGRGASAESILTLVPEIDQPGFAYLAPQAAGDTWYPYRFLEPVERNEPYLSSALSVLSGLVEQLRGRGFSSEQIMLLGFSQGACLVAEWAARNPDHYGGVMILSGGLIGDKVSVKPGSLAGTPIFLGCSDIDGHIPQSRVEESAEILRQMGGDVTVRLYRGMGHTINQDKIDSVRRAMTVVVRNQNK